jgi:hypothetical protein
MKTKNSRTRRGKSRKRGRKSSASAKNTAEQIISAENNPELLELYAAILNPQAQPQQQPPARMVHHVPRPDYTKAKEKMLSTTALRKRHELSLSPNQSDRLSHVAKLATDAPPETISADGVTGSAEALLQALDKLYRHAMSVADSFGVQTRDLTAKLHAMACGER